MLDDIADDLGLAGIDDDPVEAREAERERVRRELERDRLVRSGRGDVLERAPDGTYRLVSPDQPDPIMRNPCREVPLPSVDIRFGHQGARVEWDRTYDPVSSREPVNQPLSDENQIRASRERWERAELARLANANRNDNESLFDGGHDDLADSVVRVARQVAATGTSGSDEVAQERIRRFGTSVELENARKFAARASELLQEADVVLLKAKALAARLGNEEAIRDAEDLEARVKEIEDSVGGGLIC